MENLSVWEILRIGKNPFCRLGKTYEKHKRLRVYRRLTNSRLNEHFACMCVYLSPAKCNVSTRTVYSTHGTVQAEYNVNIDANPSKYEMILLLTPKE